MIDTFTESLVSLSDAAKLLPMRRGGKRPHISCLYRWTISGCKGVVLESVQVGGTRCTSKEALARFIERLSHDNGADDQPTFRTAAQRRRASEEAECELRRLGV